MDFTERSPDTILHPINSLTMTTPQIVRLCFIAALWIAICTLLIISVQRITLYTIFIIVASGIVVFVPLYKKYRRDGSTDKK